MKRWRKYNPLTEDQKKKDICRSYAGVYLRRGKIKKHPCFICGDKNSQMHHDNYNKPLEIIWFCRKHHMEKKHV